MIPLKEWQYKLLERLSKENCTNYRLTEIRGEFYIEVDELFEALDETQNYRQYAEEKVIELSNGIDTDSFDELYDKYYRAEGSLLNAKKKNKELEEKIRIMQSTLNEDDYDKLAFEGVVL